MFIVRLVLLSFIVNLNLFSKSSDFRIENPHIIAVLVEFQEEIPNDPLTSGNGNFLDESFDINMIWNNTSNQRCDNYLVDKPPHDSLYFSFQLEALKNYYTSASNQNINISSHILMNNNDNGYYRLSKSMKDYSYSDNDLALLFKESLEIAEDDILDYIDTNSDINIDDIIFTIFHAGIGQDFSFPTFDPSIYDIKSAYIEASMFIDNNYPTIGDTEVSSGILLPETQNMIYFDSIEDIFYGEDDYCDFQLGLTGTFSFLMGYALGLPPLYNTESGKPGVGVFGLMDYGAHNGRGVIPAIPSPWTRILKGWDEPINMTDSAQTNPLIFDIESNNIYKFNISEKEYFLIENHNSTLINDSLFQDITNAEGPWFDSIIDYSFLDSLDNPTTLDIFTFSPDSSVITSVSNYDLGLPGSGILIWHIEEPINIDSPINNDRFNKAVSIEEADGAIDIGFENYQLFIDLTNGTKWDFWYLGNTQYNIINNNNEVCYDQISYQPLDYVYKFECENNGGLWTEPLIFDKYSNPNSNLNDQTNSFFSFELIDSISGDIKRVKVKYESEINYNDYSYLSNYSIIGTSPENIFYQKNNSNDIYEFNLLDASFEYREDLSGNISSHAAILTNSNNESSIYQCDESFMLNTAIYLDDQDSLVCVDGCQPFYGYFNNSEIIDEIYICSSDLILTDNNLNDIQNLSISTFDISIGDIDSDGLDEIVWTEDGKIMAANINGAVVNGFPIDNSYSGTVLILEDENQNIVMVARSYDHINIISLDGTILYSLPSIHNNDILTIDGKITDGVRFYDFYIGEGSYWLQKFSGHSHYPFPSGSHVVPDYQSNNQKINKFYNYPNPINDGETTFRFMVHEQTDININIYSITGNNVDQLKLKDPIINEYNEIIWNVGSLKAGLYFAEIISDDGTESIVKVVIGY